MNDYIEGNEGSTNTATNSLEQLKTSSGNSALLPREKHFKWVWMMNYCKLHGLPPANDLAWKKAEQAFIQAHGDQ